MNGTLRGALLGASVLAIGSAAGCSRSEFSEATAPQSAYVEAPASAPSAAPSGNIQTTELLGGPAPTPAPVYSAPPPARAAAAQPGYATMAPIPNPEDMTPAQRARVYGPQNTVATAGAYGSPAYAAPERTARVDGQRTVRRTPQPNRPVVTTTTRPAVVAAPAGPVSTRPVAQAPKAAPAPAKPAPVIAAKPAAPIAKPAAPAVKAAAPAAAAAAAKPVAPVAPAAKPVAPAAPTVAAAPAPVKPAAPVLPAKPQTKAEQLGALLAADVNTGLKFDIPANLVTGEDSIVTATLPEGLLERAQAEAAKLGLTVPARSIDARAALSGEGYTFTPNTSQAARLQKGEATTFSWQVRPTGEAREPLKLVLSGELKGGAKPQAFPITTIEKAVVAPAPAEPAKKAGFNISEFFKNLFARKDTAAEPAAETAAPAAKGPGLINRLSIPGHETVVVPAFGEVKSSNAVLAGLGVLLAIILAALAGQASSRRKAAERRRKFRTMADFGTTETETVEQPAPEPVAVHHAPETHAEPVAETHEVAHDDHTPHKADSDHRREPEHV